jgi:hypothetical protein
MTQEPDRRPSSPHRRSTRAGRNRPVLVTSTENEESAEVVEEAAPTLEKSLSELEAQNPLVAPSRRRLPNFFSTIGKKTEAPQEVDTAQARLARATRGKVSPAKPSSDGESDQKAEVKRAKEPVKPATPPRPAGVFKTRYLIGMALYLLGANFIGAFETNLFRANHIDDLNHPLTQFNLFGGLVKIYPSTLAFLATLIILLVALARLDLIPRSFSALGGQTSSSSNRRGGSSNNNQNRSDNVRSAPPTMRQGVKGADDDLYQEYRTNQRRRKK